MFDDNFFDDWLDSQAQKVMEKVANGEGIAPEQMMILMLKAQTNHFAHLDVDLRNEMILLREDMDKRFEQVDRRFEQMQQETAKRFEQVDKRFEQVDKRFEQMQQETARRFDQLTSRIDHFMIWSFATTVSVGGLIVALIKFF
jgi:Fe2+ transport system protein B